MCHVTFQAYRRTRFTSSHSHLCPEAFQRPGDKNVSSALPPSRTVLCCIYKIPPSWPSSQGLLLDSELLFAATVQGGLSLPLSGLASRQQECRDSRLAPLSTKAWGSGTSEDGPLPLPLALSLHYFSLEQDARENMLRHEARVE